MESYGRYALVGEGLSMVVCVEGERVLWVDEEHLTWSALAEWIIAISRRISGDWYESVTREKEWLANLRVLTVSNLS